MSAEWVCRPLPILAVIPVTGCASAGKNLVRDGVVEVEKVSSRQATMRFVQVVREDSEVVVRGQIQRWPVGRGPIPGHIDLQLIGPDGGSLERARIDDHRRSVKSRYAEFHVMLKTMPSAGSTPKVIHDTRSHAASGSL